MLHVWAQKFNKISLFTIIIVKIIKIPMCGPNTINKKTNNQTKHKKQDKTN